MENGHYIGVMPDTRKKPDKFSRIEGNLEPLVRMSMLVFNEKEQSNPHVKRLVEQFKMFSPGMKAPADGPDAIEGGVWILNQKRITINPDEFKTFGRAINNKRI